MTESRFDKLLQAKLRIPEPSTSFRFRERLNRHIETIQATPLTLVNAPVGYGKTTFLQQYALWAESAERAVAWVSYDSSDNSVEEVLEYLVAAIAKACEPLRARLAESFNRYQTGSESALVTAIISILEEWDKPLLLLLDNTQHIRNETMHRCLQQFVKYMPENVRCVLASGETLNWIITDVPSNEKLALVDQRVLRFTADETAALLAASTDAEPKPTVVPTIMEVTEGWAAAIQLLVDSAAITGLKADNLQFVGNTKKALFAYLANATHEQLDSQTLAFLLQVAPLTRFNTELADLVTGLNNTSEILATLEAKNLFLVPVGDDSEWFRFHNLFNEFLMAQLHRNDKYDLVDIHTRASRWFADNNSPIEAMHHALAAGDTAQISNLLDSAARRSVRYSRRNVLEGWLERIPSDQILKAGVNATLAVIWSHITAQKFELAKSLMEDVDEILSQDLPPDYARISPKDRPCLELAKVAIERFELPDKNNIDRVRRIYQDIASDWHLERSLADSEMAYFYWQRDELELAYVNFLEARAQSEAAKYPTMLADSISRMADIRLQQGRLNESFRLAEETQARLGLESDSDIPAIGHSHLIMAEISHERGQAELTLEQLVKAESLIESGGSPELNLRARLLRAWIETEHLTPELRAEYFLQIDALSLHPDVNEAAARLHAAQVWTQIDAGRLEAAHAILLKQGMPVTSPRPSPTLNIPRVKTELYLALSYYHLANGDGVRALNWLHFLSALAERAGRHFCLARVHGLTAICYKELDRHKDAMRETRTMLQLAEQHEFSRSILSLAPQVSATIGEYCALRQQLFKEGRVDAPPLYALRLINSSTTEFEDTPLVSSPDDSDSSGSDQGFVEPLTSREKEVLHLIGKGFTNQEIADELLIAITSVKWHNKNIFAKLGAGSRTQAVANARSLKLLN